jgi:methionyl-tRNA formyltransferase
MQPTDLRIVYLGTPDFAVEPLKMLVDKGYNIVGVITAPDKPAGRGLQVHESPVKVYASSVNLKVLQPEKLKNPEFHSELKALKADLQIVVAFRMLPTEVWNMPRLGTFNLHASLLPQYRGAAPINWAIINGEKFTGVTTFFLRHEIDTGNIIFQEKIEIGKNENAGHVHDKLMLTGAWLVRKTVDAIATKTCPDIDQNSLVLDKNELKQAPKIFKENCKIDWTKNSQTIHNFIRGLSPYPTAWTELIHKTTGKKIMIKIYESEVLDELHHSAPCEFISDGKTFLCIALKDGMINILSLQQESKKRLNVQEFLRGFHVEQWKVNL